MKVEADATLLRLLRLRAGAKDPVVVCRLATPLAGEMLRNWPRCNFPQGDKVGALASTSTSGTGMIF